MIKKIKKRIIVISLLSFLSVSFFLSYSSTGAVSTDNLVSYWKLDETSNGTGAVTRVDSHSTNDLTDTNTTASGTGIINNGADFELANSEYLTITDASQSGLDIIGNISVSMWVKLETDLDTTDTIYEFVNKFHSGGPAHSFRFIYTNSGGTKKLQVQLYDNADPTTNVPYNSVAQTLTAGSWFHLVYTWRTAGVVTFYVNGSSIGNVTNTDATDIKNSAGNFSIGTLGTGTQGYVDGIIDEVGIWNIELTSDEVTELYNSGAGLAYPFTGETAIEVNSSQIMIIGI